MRVLELNIHIFMLVSFHKTSLFYFQKRDVFISFIAPYLDAR